MKKAGARILVVDDEPTNRDILERRLAKMGHRVLTAADGRQCLELLAEHECDLVLLDIMMPVLDGMATLKEIRTRLSPGRLPVIMTTARDNTEDIVEALQAGANDYVTKPIDFAVLMARMDTHLRLKRTTVELARAYRRIKKEIEEAARIQRSQIPASGLVHHNLSCACRYLPCDELAGDILNYFVLNDRQLALYLLDVSGHGAGAALLSSGLSRLLTASGELGLVGGDGRSSEKRNPHAVDRPTPPGDVLSQLNRRFPIEAENSQFFTIIYAIADARKRSLRYASAGHPGPMIIRKNGIIERAGSTGLPVGVMEDAVFEENELTFSPGDKVLFFSDGVVEASNHERQQYGFNRLLDLLSGAGATGLEEMMDQVIKEVQDWSGGNPQDDVSLVGLEFG